MWVCIRGAWCGRAAARGSAARRSTIRAGQRRRGECAGSSGIPGDARKLALAVFPFGAGKNARGDFDEPRGQLKNGEGGTGFGVAREEGAVVQALRQLIVGEVVE